MLTDSQIKELKWAGFTYLPAAPGDDEVFTLGHKGLHDLISEDSYSPGVPGYVQEDGTVSLYGPHSAIDITGVNAKGSLIKAATYALTVIYQEPGER